MVCLGTPNAGKTEFSKVDIIPSYVENGLYRGTGRAYYSNNGIKVFMSDEVFVHTPVVAQNIQIKPQDFINEKTTIDPNSIYLQLDGEFEITIPDNGTHIDSKNYGARSYNTNQGENTSTSTWGALKDVKLPFDAYIHSDDDKASYFLPANTWLSDLNYENESDFKIDLKTSRATKGYKFTIPVWVEEKVYQNNEAIEVRVVAENAFNENGRLVRDKFKQDGANLDSKNYVAYKKIPVEVLGEIYDLQVNYSNDLDWKNIQSGLYNQKYVLANEFPFGNTYDSGAQLSQNANSSYNNAPKLGYSATISMKTKGRKSNNLELNVKGFSFVPKSGGNSQEVDLWYRPQTGSPYVKIEPGSDIGKIYLAPASGTMNINSLDLVRTSQLYSKEKRSTLYNKFLYTNLPYNYSMKIDVGSLGKVTIPQQFRFAYDNTEEYSGVDGKYKDSDYEIFYDAAKGIPDRSEGGFDRIFGSVGIWYGSYGLPNTTIAVPKGTNPNGNASAIKKNGYILVSFDITSKYNMTTGGRNYDYLNYKGPEARYKKTESSEKAGLRKDPSKVPEFSFGETKTIRLENGKTATVPANAILMYESDLRAAQDYTPGSGF